MCIVRSYSCASIEKERLIPYQGKDSNSFLHMTLTKSINKSMMIDQASQRLFSLRIKHLKFLINFHILEILKSRV